MTSTRRLKPPRKNAPDRRQRATDIEVLEVQALVFRAEAQRQSLAVRTSRSAPTDQAFIDAVSVSSDE